VGEEAISHHRTASAELRSADHGPCGLMGGESRAVTNRFSTQPLSSHTETFFLIRATGWCFVRVSHASSGR